MVDRLIPHLLVFPLSYHPARKLVLKSTYGYPTCLENLGDGGVAPFVPTEVGYDTHAQRTLPVPNVLINEALVEAMFRPYSATSHSWVTNSGGLRVTFSTKVLAPDHP